MLDKIIRVSRIEPTAWECIGSRLHMKLFGTPMPPEAVKFDFALVGNDPKTNAVLGYVTCKEIDGDTLLWSYGGAFGEAQEANLGYRLAKALRDWTGARYLHAHALVGNSNFRMLRIMSKLEFYVIGMRVIGTEILLEHKKHFGGL